MIDWKELNAPRILRTNTESSKQVELSKLFDEQYNDGLLVLAMAVVRQWIIDRKPVTEYPFVLPWIQYIQEALPDAYISYDLENI